MNSLWLVLGAMAAFAVAYRFYGAFLATKVGMLKDESITPAHRLRDDVDYHPTRRLVLFGVHFAAIAGPGPLVGPVLASQWGYLPGYIWIVIGACLAGAVHDFVVLLASVRHNGQSLPKIARELLGPFSGATTTLATLFIVIATLSGVGMVVVKALSESSWGMFTILVTIPAALITGLWMNVFRPGRIGEASAVGVTLVLLGVIFGKPFADSSLGHYLVFSEPTLSIILPVYAAIASILPVWILLCPRDYLSSYMKIGVIVFIAGGILCTGPVLRMPATTPFVHGGGPVYGSVWPFVCIVIMCGALSGFHALVGSGTTPKMVDRESDIRPIGYGAMLLEGLVSITALVAACTLEPGEYFKINIPLPQNKAVQTAYYEGVVEKTKQQYNWDISISDEKFAGLQEMTGEQELAGRTGGAVTLAIGMAKVFSDLPGMKSLSAYWYHFVIMFEALFILTLLETGTRVARFIFEESVTQFFPQKKGKRQPNWALNVLMSVLVCFLWGYLLYTGSIDALWKMMGIANQLLAIIALAVGTMYLLKHSPKRVYALCTAIPLVFVVATVFTAGIMQLQAWWADLGQSDLPAGKAFSLKLMSVLASIMLVLTSLIVIDAVRRCWQLLQTPRTEPEREANLGTPEV